MSMLLAAPGVGFVLFQALPPGRAVNQIMIMLQVQVLLGVQFLTVNARSYLSRAFEVTRQFLFKWTVNWRFVGEETFLARRFGASLLIANLVLLAMFAHTRWTKPAGLSPMALLRTIIYPLPPRAQQQIGKSVTAEFTMITILSSLVVGLLCARTLHYQFFAYLSWTTPFLLWKSQFPAPLAIAIWGLQELAWNIYPSTNASSSTVVACLALQVVGIWYGTREDLTKRSHGKGTKEYD